MRFAASLLLVSLLQVLAQEKPASGAERFDYQSDVARLRKIVIESLYSHRDVFLRELVSNANDAIEKFRVVSLSEGIVENNPLNITMKLVPEGSGGKLIISDTGIGMTPEELAKNLGTLAKSGTSDFLARAEESRLKGESTDAANLIGQFGLGFYSSFLVASDVYVASVPAPSKANPNPTQHVFYSASDASSFDVYPDPRGNTLGRGTEITLVLKEDASEFLEEQKVRELVAKHSAFSTAYPIYLWSTKSEEVPLTPEDEGYVAPEEPKVEEEKKEEEEKKSSEDDDEVIVEDAPEIKVDVAETVPQTKTVTTQVWDHLNNQPPIWMRDPKTVTDQEYNEFYRATFKDPNNPIAWHHFKGDTGSGTSFRALIFIPPDIPKDFWTSAAPMTDSVRLFVKRVFITNDLGEQALPKWISWLRAIIDADDLPLNVSRETLQSTKFMAQAKAVLVKRFIALMQKIAAEDEFKYNKMMKAGYAPLLKLGAIETPKEQKRLLTTIKFTSNIRDAVTLDEYIEKRKKGQDQIFYLAGIGESPENLAKSIFVEKLTARGYEVLLLSDPMDEILFSQVKNWKDFLVQDVAKDGLKFGDEEEDADAAKAELEDAKTKFEPLITYLKDQSKDIVADVVITNRLVTSPCAIVASTFGYSGNMQKLLQAQNQKESEQMKVVQDWAKKARNLELNPKSPLIEGMLDKVKQLNDVEEGEEKDPILEEELKEVASILIDGALVRSGFEVTDSNVFFNRVDRVLRRSLGVSESAKANVVVKPAADLPKEEAEKDKAQTKKEKLPDLEEPENLAKILDDLPFDPKKAVDINVNDEVEGKVGIVADDFRGGNEFDADSVVNLEKMLKMGEEAAAKSHDEL